jgi:hypothetical protein
VVEALPSFKESLQNPVRPELVEGLGQ